MIAATTRAAAIVAALVFAVLCARAYLDKAAARPCGILTPEGTTFHWECDEKTGCDGGSARCKEVLDTAIKMCKDGSHHHVYRRHDRCVPHEVALLMDGSAGASLADFVRPGGRLEVAGCVGLGALALVALSLRRRMGGARQLDSAVAREVQLSAPMVA
mmetsp:Transcript_42338/g.122473  ORF Transcript_42338/g.122473 Transcript_42338/m.122473 type:complete len:159 (-) Transcript_42338:46-522(-)